jgi:hypothetical protein
VEADAYEEEVEIEMEDGGKDGMSTVRKIAAGAALGVAVPAAVVIAKKLLENGDGREARPSGSERRTGRRTRSASGGSSRTKEELYNQAKRLKIEGRSSMTKAQLERAVSRAR